MLAKVPGGGAGWFAGTVVGVPASVSATRKPGTVRVVFADGAAADCGLGELRAWQKPDESAWSKRRKVRGGRHVEAANRQSAHSSVEQLDVATEEKIARWQSARKAAESLHSVGDPADIIACCRGQAPQAGGYKWRFADPRPKVDAADIDELIQMDYAIEIQKDNPKKAGTKSADLYDQYKGAGTVKEMLSLGGRRGDVSYDIAHGWITRVPAAPPSLRASSRRHTAAAGSRTPSSTGASAARTRRRRRRRRRGPRTSSTPARRSSRRPRATPTRTSRTTSRAGVSEARRAI